MKTDYKHTIVDTVRYGGTTEWKNLRKSKKILNGPSKLGYGKAYSWGERKELSDRLSPVFRLLRANVGRKWDTVWSEICAGADARSVRGHHLRSHVIQYVRMQGKESGLRWNLYSYYVDDAGVLRADGHPPWRRQRTRNADPDHKRTKALRARARRVEREKAVAKAMTVLRETRRYKKAERRFLRLQKKRVRQGGRTSFSESS